MRVEIHPQNSVYYKALRDKKIAGLMLLPLIEFEFAFNGSQKPAITQSDLNKPQLQVLLTYAANTSGQLREEYQNWEARTNIGSN